MRFGRFCWVYVFSFCLSIPAARASLPRDPAPQGPCELLADAPPVSGEAFEEELLTLVGSLPMKADETRIPVRERVSLIEIFSNRDASKVLEYAGRIPHLLRRQGLVMDKKIQNPLRDLIEIFAFTLQRNEDPSLAIESIIAGCLLIEKQDYAHFNPVVDPRRVAVSGTEFTGTPSSPAPIRWEQRSLSLKPVVSATLRAIEKLILNEKARRFALRAEGRPGFDRWPRGEKPSNLPPYAKSHRGTTIEDFAAAALDVYTDPWIWVPGDVIEILGTVLTTPASHSAAEAGIETASVAAEVVGSTLEHVNLADPDFLSSLSEGVMPIVEAGLHAGAAVGEVVAEGAQAAGEFFASILGGLFD